MKTLLATAALLVITTGAQAISPLRSAVIEFYATNSAVQTAVDIDVCHDSLVDTRSARSRLKPRDAARYDAVVAKLNVVFKTARMPTDGVLEQLNRDFCGAVANR